MFVELLDKLRCLNAHEDSPLVVTTAVTFERHIREGLLGCPVCLAEYSIHNGVVDYGGTVPVPALSMDYFSEERATKLAAMLALDERGGFYVLDCMSSLFTADLAAFSPDAQFIAISGYAEVSGARGILRCDTLPLARASARGIALDRSEQAMIHSAVLALAPGGRLVAPANADEPDGIVMLARDDEHWVGVRDATPQLVGLERARR